MKLKTMLETPIGNFAAASLKNHPELDKQTPENTRKLVAFAKMEGITIEGVICALVNWMGSNCEESIVPPTEYIN